MVRLRGVTNACAIRYIMDGREVDLLEILRVGKSKKRLQKMFTNLGGGRTDKEAVELAIGRDPEWQMALLRVIQQIELVITSKTVAEVGYKHLYV